MKTFFADVGTVAFKWKVAIFRLMLYSFLTVWSVWQTAMVGVQWSALSSQDKFNLIGGLIAAWVGVIIAFLDKTSSLPAGSPPPDPEPLDKKP